MKTHYLISVLNTDRNTHREIAELLTPDCAADPSHYDWEFCDIKRVQIGDRVEPFFHS